MIFAQQNFTTLDITINSPALLFPAISLIMLAYTNRFLALASVVRNLHDRYKNRNDQEKSTIHAQLKNLKLRLRIIKNMQILGVLSFLLAIVCMYLIYVNSMEIARFVFATSMFTFAASLVLSLMELLQSTKSLEIELSDMDNLDDPGIVDYIKDKFHS
jgi:Protein of unknown function (DUF2721)